MGGYASRLDTGQPGDHEITKDYSTDETKAVKHSLYYAGRKGRAAQLTHVAGNGDITSDHGIVVDNHICGWVIT